MSHFEHARERIKERYNIDMDKQLYRNFIKRIRKNDNVRFIGKDSNTRIYMEIYFQGLVLRCVYSNTAKEIITFLPPNVVIFPSFEIDYIKNIRAASEMFISIKKRVEGLPCNTTKVLLEIDEYIGKVLELVSEYEVGRDKVC